MRGLDEGETYVVMRNGTPVGEPTPLRRHRFVRTEAAMAMFRGPPVDYKLLQRDLDAVASQGCSTCGNRCGRQDREHMDVPSCIPWESGRWTYSMILHGRRIMLAVLG